MNKTIKTPTTVRELGDVAEEMGLTLPELLADLERELGHRWFYDATEITFSTATAPCGSGEPFRVSNASGPPAGYELAEGCSDRWIGAKTSGNGWAVIPSWNAEANLHSIELWASELADLSPADALQLAADLTAAASTGIAAGSR